MPNTKSASPIEQLFAAVDRESPLRPSERAAHVQAAIDDGADINAQGEHGMTALHLACQAPFRKNLPPADPSLVRQLIELGADVNRENNGGIRPFELAIYRDLERRDDVVQAARETLQLLKECGAIPGATFSIADNLSCDPATLRELFGDEAIVKAVDDEGNSLLHLAALYQRPDMVRLMLELGGDVDAKNHQGKTPLQLARKPKQSGYAKEKARKKKEILDALEGISGDDPVGSLQPELLAKLGNPTPAPMLLEYGKAFEHYALGRFISDDPDEDGYVRDVLSNDDEIYVFDGDTVIHGDLELDLGTMIVNGDLRVEGNIARNGDGEPILLVVNGNCSARNLLMSELMVHVEKDLQIDNGIFASIGDGMGVLVVMGDVTANVVIAEHEVWIGGTLHGTGVEYGEGEGHALHVRDSEFAAKAFEECTFASEIMDGDGLESNALWDHLAQGKPVWATE